MRVARFDRLYVYGRMSSNQFDPHEVEGKPVTVTLSMARGKTEQFSGRVVFVSLEKKSSEFYSVYAEIEKSPNQ